MESQTTQMTQDVFGPTLRQGDTVTMDNFPVHKVHATRSAIEAAGVKLLYLPPYNPDLNPIETVFAKMKAELRREARRAIDAITPTECANYIRYRGY